VLTNVHVEEQKAPICCANYHFVLVVASLRETVESSTTCHNVRGDTAGRLLLPNTGQIIRKVRHVKTDGVQDDIGGVVNQK